MRVAFFMPVGIMLTLGLFACGSARNTSADSGQILNFFSSSYTITGSNSFSRPPQFPGGDSAINAFFKTSFKMPEQYWDHPRSAKVIISFTLDTCGNVTNVKPVSKPAGNGIDEEITRVFKSMPDWIPALDSNRELPPAQIFIPVFIIPN